MKRLLRSVVFYVFALWLTSAMIPALSISGNLWGMLSAGLTLAIMMMLLKPLIALILLPVNILTLGLLGWFVNVIVLYLWSALVPQVTLGPWTFPGLSWGGFVVPPVNLSYTWSLIIISLVITAMVTVLGNINEE
ncbi:MAG: hypothetical protein UX37_C0015G0004 [Microgenomates group bacterium GW2011_GWA2_46_16]|nr:MAG: hypothetical protein UX37_C0015G0004 [Microgenomates group bacterium GW2011_GWA2_46_16]